MDLLRNYKLGGAHHRRQADDLLTTYTSLHGFRLVSLKRLRRLTQQPSMSARSYLRPERVHLALKFLGPPPIDVHVNHDQRLDPQDPKLSPDFC